MAGNRAFANQALFQARILLDVWEFSLASQGQGQQRHSHESLASAFRPAVLLHLRRAYGWYLLEIAGEDSQEDTAALPDSSASVPEPPAGRMRAPELREFALLEQEGWIGDMLAADRGGRGKASSGSTPRGAPLLVSDSRETSYGDLERWTERLGDIMQRMDDSLSEC